MSNGTKIQSKKTIVCSSSPKQAAKVIEQVSMEHTGQSGCSQGLYMPRDKNYRDMTSAERAMIIYDAIIQNVTMEEAQETLSEIFDKIESGTSWRGCLRITGVDDPNVPLSFKRKTNFQMRLQDDRTQETHAAIGALLIKSGWLDLLENDSDIDCQWAKTVKAYFAPITWNVMRNGKKEAEVVGFSVAQKDELTCSKLRIIVHKGLIRTGTKMTKLQIKTLQKKISEFLHRIKWDSRIQQKQYQSTVTSLENFTKNLKNWLETRSGISIQMIDAQKSSILGVKRFIEGQLRNQGENNSSLTYLTDYRYGNMENLSDILQELADKSFIPVIDEICKDLDLFQEEVMYQKKKTSPCELKTMNSKSGSGIEVENSLS